MPIYNNITVYIYMLIFRVKISELLLKLQIGFLSSSVTYYIETVANKNTSLYA